MPTPAYLHLSHGVKLYCNSTDLVLCQWSPIMNAVSVWSLVMSCPGNHPYSIIIQAIASLPANQGSPGVMHASPKSGSHFRYPIPRRVWVTVHTYGAHSDQGRYRSRRLFSLGVLALLPISSQLGVRDRGGQLVLPSLLLLLRLLLLLLLPLLLSL